MNVMKKIAKLTKKNIMNWISRPHNHMYKEHNGGYVLYSGYFSGDDIPFELQNILSDLYDKYGLIAVEFTED